MFSNLSALIILAEISSKLYIDTIGLCSFTQRVNSEHIFGYKLFSCFCIRSLEKHLYTWNEYLTRDKISNLYGLIFYTLYSV